jgi:hypothetical protein
MSLTGASADEWCRSSRVPRACSRSAWRMYSQGEAASRQRRTRAGLDTTGVWRPRRYAPDKVAQITALPRNASSVSPASSSSSVRRWRSSAVQRWRTPTAVHRAGHQCAEALLGADAEARGIFFTPDSPDSQPLAPSALRNLSAKVLLLDEANAVFCVAQILAGPRNAREDSIHSPASAASSTTPAATRIMILPESLVPRVVGRQHAGIGSIEPLTTVAGPVMKPLHNTRATVDVIIEVAGQAEVASHVAWKSAEELANSKPTPGPGAASPIAPSRPGCRRRSGGHARARQSRQFRQADAASYSVPLPCRTRPQGVQRTAQPRTCRGGDLQEICRTPLHLSAMWSSWVERQPANHAERPGRRAGWT